MFVLDVSLVFLLPPPVSASDFEDIWVSLKPENAGWKCQGRVIVQGMTSWHIWDEILSVWLGKSLWVTSRGGSCLQLPDPPTRQDPRSSSITGRARNTFWQTELSPFPRGWPCHLCASGVSFRFYHFIVFFFFFFLPHKTPLSPIWAQIKVCTFPNLGEEAALADAVSWFTKPFHWQQQLPTLLIQGILILGLPLGFTSWLLLNRPSFLNKKRLYICGSYMQLSHGAKQTEKGCRHMHMLMQLSLGRRNWENQSILEGVQ